MPARTLSTMFIWHTELLIISLLFCTAFAAALFTLDMYSPCIMDLTTSLSVCTSALVTLICHVIIACSKKQDIVSKDAKEHASVSLALVQVVFCITLVHTLFQKEDFSVICFGATSAFNGLATCLSFECIFWIRAYKRTGEVFGPGKQHKREVFWKYIIGFGWICYYHEGKQSTCRDH